MPEVSICIPTYDGARYLEPCLESAVRQSFTDMEILVVDDGSTDETLVIARRFAGKDRRVRLISNRGRLGLVGNWNRCLQYAVGEWVKFLFQDDVLTADCVEKMWHSANAENGSGPNSLVVCERAFKIEEGVDQGLRHFYTNSVITLDDVFPGAHRVLPEALAEAILARGAGCNFIGEPTSVMMRRSLCFKHSFFNEGLIHLCDLEYWTRLGTNEGLLYLPEKLAVFRVHGRSASAHNHAHHPFELAHLDRLILLHDYLYHPSYVRLRKAPGSEAALSRQLEDDLGRLVDSGHLLSRRDHGMKWDAVIEKYPALKQKWMDRVRRV